MLFSFFFFFLQVSPPALKTERTNSGKQTCREINTEAQRHAISSVTASAALDCCPPFSVSHLQALEEARSRLQPPQHLCLDLCFPLHRHRFDFTVCRKWQPPCLFPAFYRGNWVKFQYGSDGNLWKTWGTRPCPYNWSMGQPFPMLSIHPDHQKQPQFPHPFNSSSVWKRGIHHKKPNQDHKGRGKTLKQWLFFLVAWHPAALSRKIYLLIPTIQFIFSAFS